MLMSDYVARYDQLGDEDELFRIPARKEFVLSRIGEGKRVLDVGCLGGRITRLIMRQGNEVVGVEANPKAAEIARGKGIPVKVANVEQGLPFEAGAFDVVHAGEIVEHLFDTRFFFTESFRVLRASGELLFSVPNLNSLENRIRIVGGGYLATAGAYPEDRFGDRVRVFNLDKVRELCAQTGFEVAEVQGVHALEARGTLVDASLGWVGRFLPGMAKILLVRAVKAPARGSG